MMGLKPKTKVILGIAMVFISGLLSSYFIPVILIEFGGGRLAEDIEKAEDITDIPKPPLMFVASLLLTGSYGLPFLVIGIFLIIKNTKSHNDGR